MEYEFWGKSRKTNGDRVLLEQHISDVVRAAGYLVNDKYNDSWWQALKIAAFVHDTGKIDPDFQNTLRNKQCAVNDNIKLSHNILALFLLNEQQLENNVTQPASVLSAIIFHHWRDYYVDLIMGSRADIVKQKAEAMLSRAEEWETWLAYLRQQLQQVAEENGIDSNVIKLNKVFLEYFCHNSLLDSGLVMPPYTLALLPQRLKSDTAHDAERFRVFITGNLMRCDHFASMVETADDNNIWLEAIEHRIYPSYTEIAESLNFGNQQPWQKKFFDDNRELRNNNLILIAPTGAGKTEFAYLWGAGHKNFFILPMQAAVNSIFTRTEKVMVDISGDKMKNRISLLHGNTAIERLKFHKQQAGSMDEEQIEGEVNQFLNMAKHFAEPYIIATADQIVPSALRYPGYERTYAVLMNAAVIIDEVQAYDPKAAAIITYLLQSVAFLDGQVLLMTATLPPFIKTEICKRLELSPNQIVNVLEEDIEELDALKKAVLHKISFYLYEPKKDDNLPGDLDKLACQMLEHTWNNKKVLVIFNTVKRAQEFYQCVDKLKHDDDIILFHSRFTVADKMKIEDIVVNKKMPNSSERPGGGCLVISTQVVEASLNIDADIMYTELCPIDSLLQRMGRVLRRFVHTGVPNDLQEPNVVILLDKDKGSSGLFYGKNSVYNDELVASTLLCLLALAANVDFADETMTDLVKEISKNALESILAEPKKAKKSEVTAPGLSELKAGLHAAFTLKAYQKNKLVDKVYGLLQQMESSYIKAYFDTLETLDYGYCADKVSDARNLFREVSNIEVLPNSRVNEFNTAVNEWLETNSTRGYSSFKKEIVNQFIVSVPYRSARSSLCGKTAWECVQSLIQVDNKIQQRLERWLGSIRIVEGDYNICDKQVGLVLKKCINVNANLQEFTDDNMF